MFKEPCWKSFWRPWWKRVWSIGMRAQHCKTEEKQAKGGTFYVSPSWHPPIYECLSSAPEDTAPRLGNAGMRAPNTVARLSGSF